MSNKLDYLNDARRKIIDKYGLKFDNGFNTGYRATIYTRALNGFINCEGRYFRDAGIELIVGETASKKISERGYFIMIDPMIGRQHWQYKQTSKSILIDLLKEISNEQ